MTSSDFQTLRSLAIVVLGLALVPAASAAQEPAHPEDGDRDNCICFDAEPGEAVFGRLTAQRARLGIFLGETVDVDGRGGVEVLEVVDGGPAAKAGLEAGDVITGLDGRELGSQADEALREAMGDVDPGDTVDVVYYRDGERRTAAVATDSARNLVFGGEGFDVRLAPLRQMGRLRDGGHAFSMATPRAFMRRLSPGGLELVALNPELGEYFDTDEGVLVTAVDRGSELGLRPGDVILSIDGREAADPAHVRAILSSYRPDEAVTFQVVREERRMEVSGTVR